MEGIPQVDCLSLVFPNIVPDQRTSLDISRCQCAVDTADPFNQQERQPTTCGRSEATTREAHSCSDIFKFLLTKQIQYNDAARRHMAPSKSETSTNWGRLDSTLSDKGRILRYKDFCPICVLSIFLGMSDQRFLTLFFKADNDLLCFIKRNGYKREILHYLYISDLFGFN